MFALFRHLDNAVIEKIFGRLLDALALWVEMSRGCKPWVKQTSLQ